MANSLTNAQLLYKQWADNRTLEAVSKIDSIQYPSEFAFSLQQMNHMVRVEEVFRARLLGLTEPHATSNSEVVPSLEELGHRLSKSNDWLRTYFELMSIEMLNEIICFKFLDGQIGSMTRKEVQFHLINHGTYHRGSIGRALDIAGGLRPADTYTVFVHATEPERRL